jgi:hypothetical protein
MAGSWNWRWSVGGRGLPLGGGPRKLPLDHAPNFATGSLRETGRTHTPDQLQVVACRLERSSERPLRFENCRMAYPLRAGHADDCLSIPPSGLPSNPSRLPVRRFPLWHRVLKIRSFVHLRIAVPDTPSRVDLTKNQSQEKKGLISSKKPRGLCLKATETM